MKKCRGWKTDPLTAEALPKAAAAANGEEIDVTQFFFTISNDEMIS